MKLAKLTCLIPVGLTLSIALVGCRKGLDKPTTIPGSKPPTFTEKPGPPIGDANPTTPLPPGGERPLADKTTAGVLKPDSPGIAAAKGDFSNWSENRDEFKAQTVYFDFDKANIKPSELGKIEEVARRMKSSFQGKALRIEGHCDERGTEEYNRALGDRRALSVREKFVALGLDPEMIPTITFGEEKPANPGHNEAAWAKNRRAEMVLLSPPGAN
jgi:peptidoglycan-associated lipoprotein